MPLIYEGGIIEPDMPDYGPALVVCAYDPGETTGWFAIRAPLGMLLREGSRRTLLGSRWALGQVSAYGAGAADTAAKDSVIVDRMLEVGRAVYEEFVYEDDVFVFATENFRLRERSSEPSLLSPVRIQAIWQDRLRDAGIPILQHSASDAKRTCTDRRLHDWGMYRKGMQHARDAQRHGILTMRKVASNEGDYMKRLGIGL